MTKQCARCGRDLNPLTGSLETSPTKVEQLRKWAIDVPSPVCSTCFSECLTMAERRYGSEFYFESEPPPELKEKIETQVRKLEVWTVFPYPEGSVLNLGHVSHHIIVGTGPLSTIAATFSELLSQNDEVYQERLESAEAVCLRRIKEKAFSKGASAVVGLESSITELRAGRGMFLYSMSGTAVAPVRLYHP